MKFIRYESKEKFLEDNLEILLKDEALNDILIGIVLQHENSKVDKWLLGRIEEENEIKIIFLIDDDKEGLVVYFNSKNISESILEFLIDNIIYLNINLNEIYAIQEYSHKIADIYVKKTNINVSKISINDLLVIDKIEEEHILDNNEKLVKIDIKNADINKLIKIVKDIYTDTYLSDECSDEKAMSIVNIYLNKGIYILTDEKEENIYCHAVIVRKQINGCAIGAVISPKEYRGQGYGKKCIYKICETLLKKNKYIVLHVRHDNYAAKSVYEKIGFKSIGRFERIFFEK